MKYVIALAFLMIGGIIIFFLFGSITPEGQTMMGEALMKLDNLSIKEKNCQTLTYENTHYQWCR